MNLVHEIPLPPFGKAQVAISINDTTLFCSRPALNQRPMLKDVSFIDSNITTTLTYIIKIIITLFIYLFFY